MQELAELLQDVIARVQNTRFGQGIGQGAGEMGAGQRPVQGGWSHYNEEHALFGVLPIGSHNPHRTIGSHDPHRTTGATTPIEQLGATTPIEQLGATTPIDT